MLQVFEDKEGDYVQVHRLNNQVGHSSNKREIMHAYPTAETIEEVKR